MTVLKKIEILRAVDAAARGASVLIIQASNIHEGGGRTLLKALLVELTSIAENKPAIVVFLDQRFQLAAELERERHIWPTHSRIVPVRPSILGRMAGEFKMWRLAQQNPKARVFCFGNLPPIFPLKNKIILYFHTVLYFKDFKQTKSLALRVKHWIETHWVHWGLHRVSEVIVQSEFVKQAFEREFRFSRVRVFPFAVLPNQMRASAAAIKDIDFLFPAAGTSHKNHAGLLAAWEILAAEGLFPTLHLTVDSSYKGTFERIKAVQANEKIKIVNHGLLPHAQMFELYGRTKAIIFPSIYESLGLPLLEAKNLGLPILASEADYVRDLVDPVQSFDPHSARSIARAVKRFLAASDGKITVRTVADFSRLLEIS